MTAVLRPAQASGPVSAFDPSVANPARRYDFLLGGKDNFAADRASALQLAEVFPEVVDLAKANRAFLGRAVRDLAARGVRQFLDIGCGLPAPNSTHEAAQQVAAGSRVVYVDHDPIVMVHARALLIGTPGTVTHVERDLRDPAAILADPAVAAMLRRRRPVALVLGAVLHYLSDDDQPHRIVRDLLRALPAGSYLVLSHATHEHLNAAGHAALARLRPADTAGLVYPRRRRAIAAFTLGLVRVEPGLVSVADWRTPHAARGQRAVSPCLDVYGVVARKGRRLR